MIKEFENPSNQFRPIPFWSWNDELEQEELRFQIEEMKKAGVGGYFMHARSGLKTPYLEEEWFQCINTGIEAGKQYGLDAWVYDEEGWPSGFAGGLVPALSPDFHSKFMTLEELSGSEGRNAENILAWYRYDQNKRIFKRLTMKEMEKVVILSDGEIILAVKKHVNEFYIDTLNKRAIEAFLKVTHEEYYKRFGDEFGTAMHGFFTDEPRLACNNFGELAWSDDLPEAFQEQHGYDILDYLPALYLNTENYEKYRYDFWTTVSDMFAKNYMKTIYDWCEAHQCKLTGHVMMEESIFSQMTSTAGVMSLYEYMHVPGIDWLRRMISSPVIGKQVGSVACQLGKKQVLTESFALCGWNVSFEELKWIAEWQFVNGVNQICQHLEAYTIKGSRKRDYPPSLFTQQTWWKEYKKFNDYLGRLCVALSEGDQTADVLLLHPMRSGFVSYDGTRTPEIRLLDQKFEDISRLLSGLHVSYHYGDETIIGNHGRVQAGEFVVGRIAYKTVIMPDMYAIDAKTLELLVEFQHQGGTVIGMGQYPHYTNGDQKQLNELGSKVTKMTEEELRSFMLDRNLLTLSIAENGQEINDISYLQREAENSAIYFLVNHSQEKSFHAQITIMGKQGRVYCLRAEDGTQKELSIRMEQENTVFGLDFEPMQSYILQMADNIEQVTNVTMVDNTVEGFEFQDEQQILLDDKWTVEEMDLNSMILDYCDYRIDDGEWQGRTPVIQLQNILLDLQRPCRVELSFTFYVSADLDKNKEFYTVIEDAQLYEIQVNETPLTYREEGWWKDKKFKKVTIKPYVRSGWNTILLKTEFVQPQKVYDVLYGENVYETEKNKITYGIELENIYLLGDFGVVSQTPYTRIPRGAMVTEGGFEIVDVPVSFEGNNFTEHGLLFFAGTLTVSQIISVKKQEGKRILLNFGKQNAPMLKLFVNNSYVKTSLWAPYQADITEAVHEGDNMVKIQLYASNRNLLGPHHHIDGECYNVGPESFTGKWSWVERKSEADATEITDRDKDYWTDTYSFVDFGFYQK